MTDTLQEPKWYYRPWIIFIAILLFGPLAIPLVWKSPRINRILKIVIIMTLIALTAWLIKASVGLYGVLAKEIQDIQRLYR